MPKAQVTSMIACETYDIDGKTLGQTLFDQVIGKLGLRQVPLFGLEYVDTKDYHAFLKMEKKISSQGVKKEDPLKFNFTAKFYPESVNEELTHPLTQKLFWLQVRSDIVADKIYCPPELCVLFAAQTMQARHGDYSEEKHPAGFIKPEEEIPQRVLIQHQLSTEQWEQKIKNAWAKIAMTPQEVAVMDYLNVVQDLEMYGVTYFEVTNKKGTKLWLGVHNLGMDIYEYHNKVTPRLGFPWTEIKTISFNDKKFTIKMSANAPDFKFYVPRFKLNKRILELCVGNHKFYTARRHAQASGMTMPEDRGSLEAKIRRTKEQLLAIREDLDTVVDAERRTKEDKIHEENKAAGMDKFKTMKKAQSGDAKKRVAEFEELEDAEC